MDRIRFSNSGLVRLSEGDEEHDRIKERFISGLGSLGAQASVVAVHKNTHSGILERSRFESFELYLQAVKNKCGGNANVKYAWYATSVDDTWNIVSNGFCDGKSRNYGLYGCGAYLAPYDCPMECVKRSYVDEDGLQHILLCRVILGKQELVRAGTQQCAPSSDEFDSGLDDISSPKKYIVWSVHLNTHIWPEFVVTFRAPQQDWEDFVECLRIPEQFPALTSALLKSLPKPTVDLITTYYQQYREKNMTDSELIERARELAGEELLEAVIKSLNAKLEGNGHS